MIANFIKGLRKSFSGVRYSRNLNTCRMCGRPAFFNTCLKCEVDEVYRGYWSVIDVVLNEKNDRMSPNMW